MTFFNSLLEKRGLTSPPLPLWRLKVTDEEYEELKAFLVRMSKITSSTAFLQYPRECTLFYAEFWRREYFDGTHSKRVVYDALGTDEPWLDKDAKADALYEAAKAGALKMKIQLYRNETTQYLDSMFYQGGLPMRLVTLNVKNSVWDRFTRGLIYRHYDFDELQLGKIATVSDSMREYCDALSDAIEKDQYMLMPFYCKDESSPWFRALQMIAHLERTRQRKLRPFSLDWEFDVDERGGSFLAYYIVNGLQRLPEEFLEQQQLTGKSFFSAQVRINGKAVDTFDYQNRFCRYTVISKRQYHEGDVVSLYLHDKQEPLLSDNLDLSVPHLLYRDKDGKYFLGNKLGTSYSLILVPEGWEIIEEGLAETELSWEGSVFKGYFIPAGFEGIITARGADGDITFSANAHLYWSEIASSPLYVPDIIEPVYNAGDIQLSLCSDGDARPQTARDIDIEYRCKGESTWSHRPSYGELMARVRGRNGEYVTPVKFLNVGDISVRLLSADKDSCSLKLSWPNGTVHCQEGTLKYNGIWNVEKSACEDPRKIHFSLVPKGNSKAQFILTVRAPFKDFSILDNDGVPVVGSCVIPYSDIERYQYHLVGQGIKAYSYGDTRRELRWDANGKLYIFEDGHAVRPIPYEGSLSTLFDSREAIRSLLDKTGKSIVEAAVRVTIEIDATRRMVLTIKESPYRLCQDSTRVLSVEDDEGLPVDYRHKLVLFNLDKPSEAHVELPYSEDEGYTLPSEVLSWDKILVTAKTKGRILPALVNPNRTQTLEERREARREALDSITAEIAAAKLGDPTWNRIIDWFNLIQAESIPASSILDLYCLAKNGKGLLTLAFQLYLKNCKSEEDLDTLTGQLISMGTDLAFQWYWIKPFSENLMVAINDVIAWDSPFLKTLYVDWAISHQHDLAEVMADISDDKVFFEQKIGICMMDVLGEFRVWLQGLFAASILDTYGSYDEPILTDVADRIAGKKPCIHIESFDEVFIDQSQTMEDPEINAFFQQFSEPGKTRNEGWLFQRVNAMAAHLSHKIDLFNEHAEIRRSILFCRKSSPKAFLIELNNKLS